MGALLSYRNLVLDAPLVQNSSGALSGLTALGNLLTPRLKEVFRVSTDDMVIDVDFGEPKEIGFVAFLGINSADPNDTGGYVQFSNTAFGNTDQGSWVPDEAGLLGSPDVDDDPRHKSFGRFVAPVTARYMRAGLSSPGPIDAGHLWAGPATRFEFPDGIDKGWKMVFVDDEEAEESTGKQAYPEEPIVRRELQLRLSNIPYADGWRGADCLYRVLKTIGRNRPIVLVPRGSTSDQAEELYRQLIFGRQVQNPALTQAPGDRFWVEMAVRELR